MAKFTTAFINWANNYFTEPNADALREHLSYLPQWRQVEVWRLIRESVVLHEAQNSNKEE